MKSSACRTIREVNLPSPIDDIVQQSRLPVYDLVLDQVIAPAINVIKNTLFDIRDSLLDGTTQPQNTSIGVATLKVQDAFAVGLQYLYESARVDNTRGPTQLLKNHLESQGLVDVSTGKPRKEFFMSIRASIYKYRYNAGTRDVFAGFFARKSDPALLRSATERVVILFKPSDPSITTYLSDYVLDQFAQPGFFEPSSHTMLTTTFKIRTP